MEAVRLCAEELFFIGKQMRAKYIDYEYVRRMHDIQQKYALLEKEYLAGLVRKGFLMEDFSGDIVIDPEVEQLLRPVFFGELESELLLTDLHSEHGSKHFKYHFYNRDVTQVRLMENFMEFTPQGDIGIQECHAELLPVEYQCTEEDIPLECIDKDKISLLLQIKNIRVGKMAADGELLFAEGAWYFGRSGRMVRRLSKEGFTSCFNRIMKGE